MVNNDGTATICATAFDLRSALVDALARAEQAEAQVAETLRTLDVLISSCARVYPEDGEPYTESDPEKFDCASFCENFGHHTLMEIRAALAATSAAAGVDGEGA